MPTIQDILARAIQQHQAGQVGEAEKLYRQVLSVQPNNPEALHLLGLVAHQAGRNDAAIDLIGRSIQINPNSTEARANLALVLAATGRMDDAIFSLREALRLQPNNPVTHLNLANALAGHGRLEEAIAEYRVAVSLNPNFAEAWGNLGVALVQSGRPEEAVDAYRRALALRPDFAGLHNNLGIALRELGRSEEAVESFRRALAQPVQYPEALSNLGGALRDLGRIDESIAAHEQAIALRPDYAEAHLGLALSLLLTGNFERGWEEYEWRWRAKTGTPIETAFADPLWDGGDITGRSILLHAEQGLGDTIQFVRYAPLVSLRGGRVTLLCQPELKSLLAQVPGVERVVARGEPLPPIELQCPLVSLPRAMGTTADTIPADIPYLRADPALAERWRQRISADGSGLSVGLVWAGKPAHRNDRRRSLSLSQLAPLAQASGARFYSLQLGDAGREATDPPAGMRLIDLAPELKDFSDTAAALANLDLLITVDTAAAHLGGAMGRRTWVLLPFAPDFRWMLNREDSPWYPTMRLFRQPQPGDWETPIRRAAEELQRLGDGRIEQ